MAGKTTTRFELTCDACGLLFDPGKIYDSAIECRFSASREGWDFPPRILPAGNKSRRDFDDCCPGCKGTWEPRGTRAGSAGPGRRGGAT